MVWGMGELNKWGGGGGELTEKIKNSFYKKEIKKNLDNSRNYFKASRE